MTAPRSIEWRDRTGPGTSGPDGFVDGVRLFSIRYGMLRQRALPWHLTTTLPGMKGYNTAVECESIEAAKTRATRILAAFLTRILAEADTTAG